MTKMTIEAQDRRALLDLDAEKAVELKFQIGREHHGTDWVGRRPILEAHDEVLDALAYVREELRVGELNELVVMELYMTLLNALQGVRVLVATAAGLEKEDGSQDGFEDHGGEGSNGSDGAERGDESV